MEGEENNSNILCNDDLHSAFVTPMDESVEDESVNTPLVKIDVHNIDSQDVGNEITPVDVLEEEIDDSRSDRQNPEGTNLKSRSDEQNPEGTDEKTPLVEFDVHNNSQEDTVGNEFRDPERAKQATAKTMETLRKTCASWSTKTS